MTKFYYARMMTAFFLLFLAFPIFAQQDNLPYLQNPLFLNPAVTGAFGGIEIRTGFNRQWSGMADAPVNFYATAHSPVKLLGKAHQLESNRWQAAGAQIFSDQAGILSKTALFVNYAVHLPITQDAEGFPIHAAMGAGLGLTNLRINEQKMILLHENDRMISGKLSEWKPDANLGFMLHGRRFFAGISVMQIMQSSFAFTQSGEQLRQVYLSGGYTYFPHESLSIHTAAVYNLNYLRRTFALQGIAEYKKAIQGGLYIKNSNALGLIAGAQIKDFARVQYAYEISFGKVQSYNNGSHQIVMIFSLKSNDEAHKILN